MSKSQMKNALRLVSSKMTDTNKINEVLALGAQKVTYSEFEEYVGDATCRSLPERFGTKLRYYKVACGKEYCCGENHYTSSNGRATLRIWGSRTVSKIGTVKQEVPEGGLLHYTGNYYLYLAGFLVAQVVPMDIGYAIYPVVER